jgi:hypothetical protein
MLAPMKGRTFPVGAHPDGKKGKRGAFEIDAENAVAVSGCLHGDPPALGIRLGYSDLGEAGQQGKKQSDSV